jgi:hypothetical protein
MFEIGKKVICVKTHSQGVVAEGKIYMIRDLRTCPTCNVLQIDVGVKSNNVLGFCICKNKNPTHGIHWLSNKLFRPLDESFAESVLENIMEQIAEEELIEI